MPPQLQKLTGKQYEQFWKALLDAYDFNRLQRMLQFRLGKKLTHITSPGSFEDVVFELIDVAQKEGWTYDLLLAARDSNLGNPSLLAFARQFGLAPDGTPHRRDLEKIIVDTNSFLDVAKWRERLGQIEGQVCRVEIQGQPYGTGFLLGSDVVMTNYHVVESVIKKQYGHQPGDIVLRFDYKRLKDGTILTKGNEYRLVTTNGDWLVDDSPYSPVDLETDPKSGLPKLDELDYALLHVDGSPGDDTVGEKPEPGAPKRGWFDVPNTTHDFQLDTPLFIVQHPKGAPLKLALSTNAVIGVNGNGTRVRYRTNTEPGSSGSPVFDQNWNLVALHHSGDPESIMPTYNEGIPFNVVFDQLRDRAVDKYLGEQEE